jgi:S-adenosylmethionine/arginine decarboxylase-like enzyme
LFPIKNNHRFLFAWRVHELVREHTHVIIRAYVNRPPTEENALAEWCKEAIDLVGMRVIGGPLVVYSDLEGNKGYTAVAILDFSHLAIHCWDEISPALIEFDLFSCKSFDVNHVLHKLNEFDIVSHHLMIVNREAFDGHEAKATLASFENR